jgi:hypothetical protein
MVKVAVTPCASLIVTLHAAVPEHPAPVHPENVDPGEGVALSVTFWPCAKLPVQDTVQLMPAGELTTDPLPLPAMVSVSGKVGWVLKVAVTDRLALIVMVQGSAAQSPVHPANTDPGDDTAVSVTRVPSVNSALHVLLQLIPLGLLVTVPDPLPAFVTVRVRDGISVNVAVTDLLSSINTVHVPVPVHGAPQPVNMDPATGVAVKVRLVL